MATVEQRLFGKVEQAGDCWRWTGTKTQDGYGKINAGGAWKLTHRLAYELLVGPIPDGLQLDHLCRNRACCNPDHLDPVTNAENHARGIQASRTHCVNGHLFDAANTYLRLNSNGRRDCRACGRERQRRYQARRLVREAQ